MIFTAPFSSPKPDQGLAYIYFCIQVNIFKNKESNNFTTNPFVLKGENVAFARFGVSVANIQDRNSDGVDG